MNYYALVFSVKILRSTYLPSENPIAVLHPETEKNIGEGDLQQFLPRKCAQTLG